MIARVNIFAHIRLHIPPGMRYLICRYKQSPTLFFIAGPPLLVYLCYRSLLFIHLAFKGNIWGLEYPLYAFIILLALFADGLLVRRINFKWLSLLEVGLLLGLFIGGKYQRRNDTINLYEMSGTNLVMIDDPQGITLNNFEKTGLFNREYVADSAGVIRVNWGSFGGNPFNFKTPPDWNGWTELYFQKPEYPFTWMLVMPTFSDKTYTQKQIDSILVSKVPGVRLVR